MKIAALLTVFLTVSCGAAPDRFGVGYSRGGMNFGGTPDAWGGFDGDLDSVSVWVEWDLHKPVTLELRALRNDMRQRAHQATVEEEEKKEKADLIREAKEEAVEEAEAGRWDWLYENLEVWMAILSAAFLSTLAIGKWMGSREKKE